MSRWLPYPVISVMLLAIWLLLYQSLAVGHVLLGGLFAVVGTWFLLRLEVPRLIIKRMWLIPQLCFVVGVDIVRSNFRVASLVLKDRADRVPGFVRIELSMRSEHGLAVLACIITATPGTTWVAYSPKDNVLVIHVLDLADDDDWGMIIKSRYERLLMEIFG